MVKERLYHFQKGKGVKVDGYLSAEKIHDLEKEEGLLVFVQVGINRVYCVY